MNWQDISFRLGIVGTILVLMMTMYLGTNSIWHQFSMGSLLNLPQEQRQQIGDQSDAADVVFVTSFSVENLLAGTARVEFFADLQQHFEPILSSLEFEDFPVAIQRCLVDGQSDAGYLNCQELVFSDPHQGFDLSPLESGTLDLLLNPLQEEIVLSSELRLMVNGFDPMLIPGPALQASWVPDFVLMALDGTQLIADQVYEDVSAVEVQSAALDLSFTWDGDPLTVELLDPQPERELSLFNPAQLPEFNTWMIPLEESAQLCVQLRSIERCYYFEHRTPVELPLPEPEDVPEDPEPETPILKPAAPERILEWQYPEVEISVHKVSRGFVSLKTQLSAYGPDVITPAEPSELFIQMKTDIPGSQLPRQNSRRGGFPVLQSLIPLGTQVILEYQHIRDDQVTIFEREYVNTASPEPIVRGQQQFDDLPDLSQEHYKASLPYDSVERLEYLKVHERIEVQNTGDIFSQDHLTITGRSDAGFIKACLLHIRTGDVLEGNIMDVSEQGNFYERLIDGELPVDQYSSLLFPDDDRPCHLLMDEWLSQTSKAQKPLVFEVIKSRIELDVLQVDWISTENTAVDPDSFQVFDLNGDQEFFLEVRVRSELDEAVELSFRFLDNYHQVDDTVAAFSQQSLPLKVTDLEYGLHRVVLLSTLPDGTRLPDLLYPLEYLPLKASAPSLLNFQYWWQLFGLLLLVTLGLLYLSLRYYLLKNSKERPPSNL